MKRYKFLDAEGNEIETVEADNHEQALAFATNKAVNYYTDYSTEVLP